MFVWIAKAEKWKEENVLFTLIPSFIGEVIKRPNRQNCNFERIKKSKNVATFPHSTFLSISSQFGRIGKGGPRRIWGPLFSFLSNKPNSRNTIPSFHFFSLPSSSCHSKHSVRETENSEKKKRLELDNQVQRQFFFLKKFYTIIILV